MEVEHAWVLASFGFQSWSILIPLPPANTFSASGLEVDSGGKRLMSKPGALISDGGLCTEVVYKNGHTR